MTSFVKTFIMFYFEKSHLWGFPGGSAVKNLPAMQETAKTSTPGWGRYYHAEMYSKLSQIFFFSGILSLPSTPKMEPAQRRTTRGPQSSSSLYPEATGRTPKGPPRANSWKERRSNQVRCKEHPAHIQRATENLQLCPSGIHPERDRICFQPSGPQLHTGRDQTWAAAQLSGRKSAAGLESITDQGHV